MKKTVWKNRSNGQLCITIPTGCGIMEGDIVDLNKSGIKKISYRPLVADLFHYGHLHSIQYAKSISDYCICGILTDEAAEKFRTKPISNLQERKAIISGLNCVDRVMVQHSLDPTENLKKIHEEFPDAKILLVQGSNWKYVHGSDYIKKIGGKVVQHPYYERLSTFKIMNSIIENKDKYKDIADFASLIKGEKIDSEYEKGNKMIVSNKTDTLKALKPLLTKSCIEKMYSFTVSDWKNRKQRILKDIKDEFSQNRIVVRSSAVNEDSLHSSMAGSFESVLNVDSGDLQETEAAIKRVIDSYKNKASESSFNQILVQSQTKGIVMSGVAFTRTLESNGPYYVVNYDDSSGESNSVTKGAESRTVKISRFADEKEIPANMHSLISAIIEIESKVPKIGLDIEFAVNRQGEVVIFQVRPLVTSLRFETDDDAIKKIIGLLKIKVKELSKRKAHLAGEKTILADMPDWNPAEIIGDNPNHLDYSLYDYIITGSAWHEARTSQGYYNVNPAKLVVLIGNKPYVDVRNSFNSFIPKAVLQKLREKLVSFYMKKLEEHPELQDKVEFEVVYTCFDLAFNDKSRELVKNKFTKEEIAILKKSLLDLTNSLVINSKKDIEKDLNSLKGMESNRGRIKKSFDMSEDSVRPLLDNAKFLLDDCRMKGTVQFSRLARLGFVGKILLKSLVNRKIIDDEFYYNFMKSISTVATEINEDFNLMMAGSMDKEDFIRKYYHLRPGSYDITSLRYEMNPNLINDVYTGFSEEKSASAFKIDKNTDKRISNALKQEGLKFDARQFLEFVRSSLEAREFSKFEFTKNLSDAMELIALAGERMGFTRQELSMLSVDDLFSSIKTRDKMTNVWKSIIKTRMSERENNRKIVLPPVIFSEKDLDIVKYYFLQLLLLCRFLS